MEGSAESAIRADGEHDCPWRNTIQRRSLGSRALNPWEIKEAEEDIAAAHVDGICAPTHAGDPSNPTKLWADFVHRWVHQ